MRESTVKKKKQKHPANDAGCIVRVPGCPYGMAPFRHESGKFELLPFMPCENSGMFWFYGLLDRMNEIETEAFKHAVRKNRESLVNRQIPEEVRKCLLT